MKVQVNDGSIIAAYEHFPERSALVVEFADPSTIRMWLFEGVTQIEVDGLDAEPDTGKAKGNYVYRRFQRGGKPHRELKAGEAW